MGSETGRKRKKLQVQTEIISDKSDQISPFVAYFPSGFDANVIQIQKDEGPEIKVFRNTRRANRLQLVVSPQESNVDFVGTSYSGEAAAAQVCTYALGILDKEKQSLKIVPVAANKIFRLEPRIRGQATVDDMQANEIKEGVAEEGVAESRREKWRELTNLFGTQRAKTSAKKRDLLYKKEDDPESQKSIQDKLESIEINKVALEGIDAEISRRNIPPHDPSATVPEKAYPLDEIMSVADWDYLLDVFNSFQSGDNEALSSDFWKSKEYPSFVCNRILKLTEIQDQDEKLKVSCIFSYLTKLIKFRDLSHHALKRLMQNPSTSEKFHNIPGVLFQKFVSMFVDSGTYDLSHGKKDLLISYILVLTLIVDKFETEMSDISRDLKMTPLSLRPHYLQLGCKIINIKRTQLVTLPVPLQLPDLKKRERPKRRRT